MKNLILTLSKSEYIKIIPDHDLDFEKISFCCNNIKLYFVDDQRQIRIGQESAGELFEPFITCLKKAINGKLQLHESLTKNLGFMQNQYYQDKTGFVRIATPNSPSTYWVGFDYEICTTFADANPHVSTWMYNDKDNNIILEVTKDYSWSMDGEDQEEPGFETYEEFMKDYQPVINRVIPRDIAVQWLEQTIQVYRSFFESEEDYQKACKRLN